MEGYSVRWKLKEFLETNGKTTYALMKASGISQATMYTITAGKKTGVDFSTLGAIIHGLEQMLGKPVGVEDVLEVVRS
jgi:DNA-binding Xre family transcriptional regulator